MIQGSVAVKVGMSKPITFSIPSIAEDFIRYHRRQGHKVVVTKPVRVE